MTETLREAQRGEKNQIIRELIAAHPEKGTAAIVALLPAKFSELGIREDRDKRLLYTAVSNVKTTSRREREAQASNGDASQPQHEPTNEPPVNQRAAVRQQGSQEATFTVDDLQSLADMARRFGGYDQLHSLVGFLANERA